MHINKVLRVISVVLALFSLVCLSFPIFSTNITDGESWHMVVRGYNMVEFSPWGSIVLILPLLIIGLMISKLKNSIKTIGILGLLMLDCFALSSAYSSTYKWVLQEATGYVHLHMNQLFYILALFLSCICFYFECNYFTEGKKMQIENVFLKEEKTKVEPIDYRTEKFYLCNKLYDSAKYKENGDVINDKSTVCFATKEGYFAALDDNDSNEYFTVELLEQDGAIGFMMGNMPTGIYGVFYEDYDFENCVDIKIREYSKAKDGKAELWVPQENGKFKKENISVKKIGIDDIRFELQLKFENAFIGAAVIQDGDLVAIVTEHNEERYEYKCISAELMAVDLCRKIYEYRVLVAMNEQKAKV